MNFNDSILIIIIFKFYYICPAAISNMLPKTTLIIAISIVLLAALIRADVEDYELRFAFNVHSDNEMP